MNKAIFLDRDGTLNVDEKGYTHKIEDFKLYDGVIDGLKLLKDYKLFIITNQSGIGRGYYTEEDMHRFNNHMLKEFMKHDIKIERVYFCPHTPDQNCDCRKPSTKFIKEASKEFNLDLKNSFIIGDHPADVGTGKNCGMGQVYLLTGHGVKHLDEARKLFPDYIAANLKQATDFILFDKEEKIIERKNLENKVKDLREMGKSIVTLNGTFDILHKGHEKIIKEAKRQGDILIMGVNSDSSVKQNKGPDRPLNNDINRAKMLACFQKVDYVTIFSEKTPIEMLKIIKPDVHVNGSEYGEECLEAETIKKNGGKLHIVPLLEGESTTRMLEGNK